MIISREQMIERMIERLRKGEFDIVHDHDGQIMICTDVFEWGNGSLHEDLPQEGI